MDITTIEDMSKLSTVDELLFSTQAEHRFWIDPCAAHEVFTSARDLSAAEACGVTITADVKFGRNIYRVYFEINGASVIYLSADQ